MQDTRRVRALDENEGILVKNVRYEKDWGRGFTEVIWYRNDMIHRNGDLRAIESTDGENRWEHKWVQYGKLHRLTGPAWIWQYGQQWFVNGEKIDCDTREKFEQLMKMKAFW